MLSYKFRHLFSRVVASLSAVGMFSLGNSSAQADSLSGAVATYNYTANPMSFSANYVDLKCDTNGMSNLLPGEVYYNTSGVAAGCKFLCMSGYMIEESGGGSMLGVSIGYKVPISGTDTTVYASSGCVARGIEFAVHDNFVQDLYYDEEENAPDHLMTSIYPFYGTNNVTYTPACVNGYLTAGNGYCFNQTKYFYQFTKERYLENAALAGYEFSGLIDKNGNMVMDKDLNPLVDNFDHLIEGKFGDVDQTFENDGLILQPLVSPENRPVLYAMWTPKTIGVNFDCDGGTISGAVPSSVTYGSSVTMPSCIMSGKVFDGWAPSDATQGFVSDLVVSPK